MEKGEMVFRTLIRRLSLLEAQQERQDISYPKGRNDEGGHVMATILQKFIIVDLGL